MDRADAVRGRLGVIQAAEPTVPRYCCARGIQNPPVAPAKKLQRFESPRLLWRRNSVCSKSNPNLTQVRRNKSFTTRMRGVFVWAGAWVLLNLNE